MDKVEDKIKTILVNKTKFAISKEDINDKTNLFDDLGMDSIEMLELIVEFEDGFGIEFDDDDIDAEVLGNVSKIVELIRGKVNVENLWV